MDNLTHSLTGLMPARAGRGRFMPRAGLLLILWATMPDMDVVSWIEGRARYLEARFLFNGAEPAWAFQAT